MFFKIDILKNFVNSTVKHLCWSLFFNEVADINKETSARVFSSEYCEIFKNNLFYRTPSVAVSVFFVSNNSYQGPSLIQFRLKGNSKSKFLSKRVVQVISSQLFQEICIKSKILSFPVYTFRKLA